MLEASGLECVRQQRRLFKALSFSLAAGERLRIAGANGSGKTSLLRILCGLLAPHAGEVRWKSQPIGALKEEYSRDIAYLGHAPAVKDDLTAAENLEITCRLAGLPVAAAQAALDTAAAAAVEELIGRHVAGGGMVIYTTHQEARIGGRVLDLDAAHA